MRIIWGFLVLILLLATASSFLGINKVSGSRMEPTYKSGRTVITRKYLFNIGIPARGDIVIYKKGGFDNDFIGRIIALPKESIRFNNGNLYIKNTTGEYKVKEAYLSQDAKTYINSEDGNSLNWASIGEYNYLILSDKRDDRLNIEEHLVNINNIRSAVVF